MRKVKFYTLVDVDSDGTEKVPMFGAAIPEDDAKQHDFWLMETVPHYYRLRSKTPLAWTEDSGWQIHCPLCGQVMQPISVPASDCSRSLYRCPKCERKEERS